ncbi:MAG: fumarate hydratase [Candidatus Abyssobacteria bacterium SURF_17]|uniref:Fumarate hydratase n=1 Tax=Candidatus Abyssobacteria bacterium SURF_17 TaxID=2093361 RepID=A0A419EVV8_9BACT|nr:MAG: fumarate hydratase [Candidatus Abyssubacteria bacterium SURF_17]
MSLVSEIAGLYRRMATDLSSDIYDGLVKARDQEVEDTPAYTALSTIIENVDLARAEAKPICQDTGYPIFFVTLPEGASIGKVRAAIIEATKRATDEIPLRPNAVDAVTGKNSGDNTGMLWPLIYFDEWDRNYLLIRAMLKGGGSENCGMMYRLPDARLGAGRDLDGVRKAVLDAIHAAQGRGCPPYVIGVALGGGKDAVTQLSKRQLLRPLDDTNPSSELAALEARLLEEANSLGIGPIGVGGKTCVMGVKSAAAHRHAASYFVDVAFCCWADRKGTLEYHGNDYGRL